MSLLPKNSEILSPVLPSDEALIEESGAATRQYLDAIVASGRRPRILFINTGHIGDTIVTIPFLRQAKVRYPSAEVGVLVARPGDTILRRGGWFDEVHVLPSNALKANNPAVLARQVAVLWRALNARWDLVLNPAPDPEDRLFAFMTAAPVRIGPVVKHNWIYSRGWTTVSIPWTSVGMHVNHKFGQITRAAGLGMPEMPLTPLRELRLTPDEQASVDRFVASTGPSSRPLVTMMVCGSKKIRRWPISRYAEAARHAIDTHHARVCIVTGPGERDAVPEITELLLAPGLCVHFNERPMLELVGLAQASRAVIATDSGPAHIAASTGANTVFLANALLAPTWVPWGGHVRGVVQEQVRDITTASVCAALDDLLVRRRSPPITITAPAPARDAPSANPQRPQHVH
jgi:ADP-heptose:LPS heptosyltransferase